LVRQVGAPGPAWRSRSAQSATRESRVEPTEDRGIGQNPPHGRDADDKPAHADFVEELAAALLEHLPEG
jgi:hypothetical protein